MNIVKTKDIKSEESIVIAIYGQPKVGKTSFAASTSKFGKTLVFDFDAGTKYLGERGLYCDVVPMQDWFTGDEAKQLGSVISDYDYIVVDTVGEAMEFLINGNAISGKKYRQNDGGLTMSGWGETKKKLTKFIKFLRASGKTIILVFHDERYKFENEMYHSLQVATKLKESIPGMVDIISYLGVSKIDDEPKRVLYTPATGSNFDSGDRTGRVPEKIIISEQNGWGDFVNALKPKNIIEPDKDMTEAEESLTESSKELDKALEESE